MDWTRRWTIDAPGNRAGAIALDVGDGTILLADGWGVAFPALSVRRLDSATGRELARVRTRTPIRAFARAAHVPNAVYFVGDSKVFLHDASTLERRAVFDTRIPRYSNGLVDIDADMVVFATSKALVECHLPTGKSRRPVALPAYDLARVDERPVAVLADGRVLARSGEWSHVGQVGAACSRAFIDPATGRVAALTGARPGAYDADGRPQRVTTPRSAEAWVASVRGPWQPRRVELPFDAMMVGIVEDRVVAVDSVLAQTRIASRSFADDSGAWSEEVLEGWFRGFVGTIGFAMDGTPERGASAVAVSLVAPA